MIAALDLGSHVFRSLRLRGNELAARRCRAAYLLLADNDARRRWLDLADVSHLTTEGFLIVPGDAAADAAAMFEAPVHDLLPNGEVPHTDPIPRQIIAHLVESLLPRAERDRDVCCFTQPGHSERETDDGDAFGARLEFVTRLVRLRGYRPVPVNPARALVLAELSRTAYTGIGIALGASGCELAVVHQGNQIATRRLSRGGRWIDEQLCLPQAKSPAMKVGKPPGDLEQARSKKEVASLVDPTGDFVHRIAGLYCNLIAELVEVVAEALTDDLRIPLLPQPLALVCGGGPAGIPGFADHLQQELDRQALPVRIAGVQIAGNAHYAIARGCLIRAALERSAPVPSPTAKRRRTYVSERLAG